MVVLEFNGEYRWLSNFWKSTVTYDGVPYPTIENAYQAAKAEPECRGAFRTCTASETKALGRAVKLRSDWEDVKIPIMAELISIKFAPVHHLEKS